MDDFISNEVLRGYFKRELPQIFKSHKITVNVYYLLTPSFDGALSFKYFYLVKN